MPIEYFADDSRTTWPMWTSVEEVRPDFRFGTKILVAVGGWGVAPTAEFARAAKTPEAQRQFAHNIARMVNATGADGVDIDWEFPGGNGEDYKQVPNVEKVWEIDAYPGTYPAAAPSHFAQ